MPEQTPEPTGGASTVPVPPPPPLPAADAAPETVELPLSERPDAVHAAAQKSAQPAAPDTSTEPTGVEPAATEPPTAPSEPEPEATTEVTPIAPAPALSLDWAAVSDVGRVRRDNQDSGYAGPHLLAVCDGVGGAARGDVASSTAISTLSALDTTPGPDLLDEVAGALEAAHRRIGDLVDEDPNLNGTSTTATVALFDGQRIGIGHIGDSRAYLLRKGQLAQLTHDHTFVQTLIDEGRITEAEARVHPHRNLILKALDATQEPDPDLSYVNLRAGDRLLLCSDGACGYLDDDQLLQYLSTGTPESAAVDLVRESLEAGSTDNVTCVVADVLEAPVAGKEQLLVGAAAELPRRAPLAPISSLGTVPGKLRFRSSRTDEQSLPLPDLPAGAHPIANDPIDPEEARYAPQPPEPYRWLRRLLVLVSVIGVLWVGTAVAWGWSQNQFYVGEHNGTLTIFRGINAEVPGFTLSKAYEVSDVQVDSLSALDAATVREGIEASSRADAEKILRQYAARQEMG